MTELSDIMQMQSMPERIAYLEARLRAVCRWLEINQPDVFSRGLWDTVEAATNYDNTSLCWRCSKPQGYFSSPCGCGAINPNVDLPGALAQQSASSNRGTIPQGDERWTIK